MPKFRSTKTYGHNLGLSACFRQWRAKSHCRFLHGYALQIHLEFEADDLDANNWVVDFGSLKPVKKWLEDNFDHKTLVAADDPQLDTFKLLANDGLIDLNVVEATGCEAFARMVGEQVEFWIAESGYAPRVQLIKCEVREHPANSGVYYPDA